MDEGNAIESANSRGTSPDKVLLGAVDDVDDWDLLRAGTDSRRLCRCGYESSVSG